MCLPFAIPVLISVLMGILGSGFLYFIFSKKGGPKKQNIILSLVLGMGLASGFLPVLFLILTCQ